jgi:hypothetical protein
MTAATNNTGFAWYYTPKSNAWTPIDLKNNRRAFRHAMAVASIVRKGSVYVDCRLSRTRNSTAESTGPKETYTLNMTSFEWRRVTAEGPSISRYSLDYIPSKDIIVSIGGNNYTASDAALAPLKTISVFTPSTGQWAMQETTGDIPAPRQDHSTVVINDKIVVYGGAGNNETIFDDVVVLDTASWTWSQPRLYQAPTSRLDSATVLVGKYMFILFGTR